MTQKENIKSNSCPYHHSPQITSLPEPKNKPAVEQHPNGEWHINSFSVAQTILRGKGTTQAGFQAESLKDLRPGRDPIIFMDGPEHFALRKNTAKYFTPKAVSAYRDLIIGFSDQLVDEIKRSKHIDLSDISLKLSTLVVGKVLGLTNSHINGLARRLEAFFSLSPDETNQISLSTLWNLARSTVFMGRLYMGDVRPAINARKNKPQDDLISHLLEQEYTNSEILAECIMYGGAGIVTTREFISVATLHMLQNPELRQDYLAADQADQHEMLHEILRLEPVVSHLSRRVQEPLELEVDGEIISIPAGDLIRLNIYQSNEDESVFGQPTDKVCPHRSLPKSVLSPGLSFGDGVHRCPGAYIAIEETNIFLNTLLKENGLHMVQRPKVSRNPLIKGYEIRNFLIAID